jgi:hypothetical protein
LKETKNVKILTCLLPQPGMRRSSEVFFRRGQP